MARRARCDALLTKRGPYPHPRPHPNHAKAPALETEQPVDLTQEPPSAPPSNPNPNPNPNPNQAKEFIPTETAQLKQVNELDEVKRPSVAAATTKKQAD